MLQKDNAPALDFRRESIQQAGDGGETRVSSQTCSHCPTLCNLSWGWLQQPSNWSLGFHPCLRQQSQHKSQSAAVRTWCQSCFSTQYSPRLPTSLIIKARVFTTIIHFLYDLPPWCSSYPLGPLPPQGLCTCCFLFLECSSPKYLQGLFFDFHFAPY